MVCGRGSHELLITHETSTATCMHPVPVLTSLVKTVFAAAIDGHCGSRVVGISLMLRNEPVVSIQVDGDEAGRAAYNAEDIT